MGITDREAPIPVYTDLKFVSISAGTSHTCAITAIGDAWCWGDDSYGESTPPTGLVTTSFPVRLRR